MDDLPDLQGEWRTTAEPGCPIRVHVMPPLAEPDHITSGLGCWCGPYVTFEDPLTGDRVITHAEHIA